jgi:hypothetical protein
VVQFIPLDETTKAGWFSFKDPEVQGRRFEVLTTMCASCSRPIVVLQVYREFVASPSPIRTYENGWLIWPRAAARKPLPESVPGAIAADYRKAALVLPHAEEASAALSRRCLQLLLREAGKTKSRDLADQIDEVLPTLPGYLQHQLDAIRNIGNFAAHPQKSKATGEIIDVEPGEAEWNLDVLDLLFDFYYQQPRIAQEKRAALDKKLADAGKPPMK